MHLCHSPARRRCPLLGTGRILAAVLLLGGCTPKAERAAQFDAMADQMLAAQAYPAAVQTLQRALKLDSNNADRWVKMGRAERSLGHDALSATSYLRASELAPDNVEALQALSVLLVRGGQIDQAKIYVSQLMVLAPDDIGGLLAQGAIALRERRLIDADRYAERVMALAPSISEGFILKARVIELRGYPAAAAALLTKRLAFDPSNADLAAQALRLDRASGNREGVRDMALLLAKLVPDDPRYRMEAARTYAARGDRTQAETILADLRQRYRGNPAVLLAIANQWRDSYPRDEAIGRIAELTRGSSGRGKAALASLLVKLGEPRRAAALLEPALGGKVDGDTVDVQAAYAGALLAMGQQGPARARAEQVLAYDYHNGDALIVRAKIKGMARDFRNALDDAQLVMSQDPQNSEAPLLVARLWAQQGNAVLADKAYGTAQDRFPDDFAIHRERVAWLVSQGRAGDAASLATSFANQHAGAVDATQLMASACQAAHDPICAADARQRLARSRA